MNKKDPNNIQITIMFSIYLLLIYGIYSLGQKYKNPHSYIDEFSSYEFIKTEEKEEKGKEEEEEEEEEKEEIVEIKKDKIKGKVIEIYDNNLNEEELERKEIEEAEEYGEYYDY